MRIERMVLLICENLMHEKVMLIDETHERREAACKGIDRGKSLLTYSSSSRHKTWCRFLQASLAACRCNRTVQNLRSIQVRRSIRHSPHAFVFEDDIENMQKKNCTSFNYTFHYHRYIDFSRVYLLCDLRACHSAIESCTALSIRASSSYCFFCCSDWLDFANVNISRRREKK